MRITIRPSWVTSLPLSWAIDPTVLVQQIEQRLRADWAPWRAFGWGTPHVRVASFDAPWPDAVAAAPTATTAVGAPGGGARAPTRQARAQRAGVLG